MYDYQALADAIAAWLRSWLERVGKKRLVLGISGGVDAAVCAGLCARAVGPELVSGALLISQPTASEYEHGRLIAETFGIRAREYNLIPVYDSLRSMLPPGDAMALGNLRDRLRGAVLYYLANAEDGLVVSTVNKNEYLLGYFCKSGSGVADLLPIGDLLKTHVWALGGALGVPQAILDKAPTGDYWPGQTDEEIIGVRYTVQDKILAMLEENDSPERLGVASEEVARIRHLRTTSEHKRNFPPRFIIDRHFAPGGRGA